MNFRNASVPVSPASLMLLFVMLTNFYAKAQPAPLVIEHLSGDYYIYTTAQEFGGQLHMSNSMYLVTGEGIVLFDTPWDTTRNQPLMDSLWIRHQKKVVMCIVTHHHDDRTGGLDFLNRLGVQTWSSAHTLALCREYGDAQARFIFNSDTVFNIGGHSIYTYYPGAGHTADNIVLWFPAESILYGGCFIKSRDAYALGNLAEAEPEKWLASAHRLKEKFPEPAFVIPGHYDWKQPGSLGHTIQLINQHLKQHRPEK